MTLRKVETRYAYFTLAFVAVFAPLETFVSWEYGLLSPYYLVDAIAIGLLFAGALRSLCARPRSAPSLITVGWAWAGANFWRAGLARGEHVRAGGELNFGLAEMRTVVGATALAMACVGVGMLLTVRSRDG